MFNKDIVRMRGLTKTSETEAHATEKRAAHQSHRIVDKARAAASTGSSGIVGQSKFPSTTAAENVVAIDESRRGERNMQIWHAKAWAQCRTGGKREVAVGLVAAVSANDDAADFVLASDFDVRRVERVVARRSALARWVAV